MSRTIRAVVAVALAMTGLASLDSPSSAGPAAAAAPRLAPSRVTLEASASDPLKVTVGFRVTNRGIHTSPGGGDRRVRVELVGATKQYPVGTLPLRPLDAGRSVDKTLKGRLPAGVAPGSYRARVCVRSGGRDRCARSRTAVTVDVPQLQLDHPSHDFGGVLLGSSSDLDVFTVTNAGDLPTQVLAAEATGDDADSYDLSADTCTGAPLGAGASCTVSVTFTPSSRGASTAHLVLAAQPDRPLLDRADTIQAILADLAGTGQAAAALTSSTDEAAFGDVLLDSVSDPQTVTLTNTGDLATGTLSDDLTGNDAYVLAADTCAGSSLEARESCVIAVTFGPSATGPALGTLSVTGAPGGDVSVTLTGVGQPPADVTIDPGSQDFGGIEMGADSDPQVLTVTNVGDERTGTLKASLGGADPTSYYIAPGSDDCSGAPLDVGSSCTVSVSFRPTSRGALSAQLTIQDGTQTLGSADLAGTGLHPAILEMTPTLQDFGPLFLGTASDPATFSVSNTGDLPSGTLSVSLTGDSDFFLDGGTCSGAVLAAGDSCTVEVTFIPLTDGALAGTLVVTGSPGGTVSATVEGNGGVSASLAWDLESDFGAVEIAADSTQVVTITNLGADAAQNLVVSFDDNDAGAYSVTVDTCTGVAVAGGATCTFAATFSPESAGEITATLVASYDGGELSATLTGTGAQPAALDLSPSSYEFDDLYVGEASAPQQFTVANSGDLPTGVLQAALSGGGGSSYQMSHDTCSGAPLGGGATCTVSVAFVPQTAALLSEQLVVSDAAGSLGQADLEGYGLQVTLSTDTKAEDFGDVPVGGVSSSSTVTVTNNAGLPTGELKADLVGEHAGDYFLTADTCTGATVAPGDSCTVDVTFGPTAAGDRVAELRVTGTPGGIVSTSLTGSGLVPAPITMAPDEGEFGPVVAGADSQATTFTISNPSDGVAVSVDVAMTGGSASEFTMEGTTCDDATQLTPGGSCTVTVLFSPTDLGPAEATLSVSPTTFSPTHTPSVAGLSATLSGTGVPDLSPASSSFGEVPLGATTEPMTFTVTNTTDEPWDTPMAVSVTGDADFGVVHPGNGTDCTSNQGQSNPLGQVNPGDSCTVSVTFSPSETGPETAQVNLVIEAMDTGVEFTATMAVTGTGADYTVAAPMIDAPGGTFGPVPYGQTGTVTFVVSNPADGLSGALALNLQNLYFGDPAFSISSSTCGASLLAGESCTVDVAFSPPWVTEDGVTYTFEGSLTATITSSPCVLPPVCGTPSYSQAASVDFSAQGQLTSPGRQYGHERLEHDPPPSEPQERP